MARTKKVKVVETPVVTEESTMEVAVANEVKEPLVIKANPTATGKFYAFAVAGGYVVVGREGQIVSKPMAQSKAEETAARFNR